RLPAPLRALHTLQAPDAILPCPARCVHPGLLVEKRAVSSGQGFSRYSPPNSDVLPANSRMTRPQRGAMFSQSCSTARRNRIDPTLKGVGERVGAGRFGKVE